MSQQKVALAAGGSLASWRAARRPRRSVTCSPSAGWWDWRSSPSRSDRIHPGGGADPAFHPPSQTPLQLHRNAPVAADFSLPWRGGPRCNSVALLHRKRPKKLAGEAGDKRAVCGRNFKRLEPTVVPRPCSPPKARDSATTVISKVVQGGV